MTVGDSSSPEISGLIDSDGAGQILGTSARHVRRLVAERRIRFVRIGRYVRFRPADLEEFIDAAVVEEGEAS